MFIIRFLLRLFGFSPKTPSAAEIRKQQVLERNKKLHIIMNAMRTHDNIRGEGQAQVVSPQGDKAQVAVQTLGESLKKAAQEHDQTSVIGKSKSGKAGWRQRTGRSRTVRKRVRRRRERSLTLWR